MAQKTNPVLITDESFDQVPARLRAALGRLVGAPGDDLILGNSTSYGLNLLVQGIPWRAGDEVLLVDGDFPATIFPWLPLRHRGVDVRLFEPVGSAPTVDELARELRPETRVLCSSWVFSLTGAAIDIDEVGALCRERGVTFVLNGSQAVGVRPIAVERAPIDALVSCGFKWLCGPYATGFAWIRPELRESLTYEQSYWLAHGAARGVDYTARDDLGARAFDVFCPANFLLFGPWTASIEHLLGISIERVAEHSQALVEALIDAVGPTGFEVISPRSAPRRSSIAFLDGGDPDRNLAAHSALAEAGVDVAVRADAIRVSPHLHNGLADIERLVAALPRGEGTRQ